MKLSEIAKRLNATLEGEPQLEITGVAGIEEAPPGDLTFLVNRKYRSALDQSKASAVLVAAKDPVPSGMSALRSANPYLDFAHAIEIFHPLPVYAPSVHPTAVVAKSARVGEGAHIGPYCFIDEN